MYSSIIALSTILDHSPKEWQRSSDYVHGFYVGTSLGEQPGTKESYLFYKEGGRINRLFKIGSRISELTDPDRIIIMGTYFIIQLPIPTGSVANFLFERNESFIFVPLFKSRINGILSANFALNFPGHAIGHAMKYDDNLVPPFTHFVFQVSKGRAQLKKVRSAAEDLRITKVTDSSIQFFVKKKSEEVPKVAFEKIPLTSDADYWNIGFKSK